MARKKDLGGLAALAGLAYMASRDKAAKGDAPTGDDQYNPDVKTSGTMSEKEPGWDTKGSEFGTEKEPGWDTKPSTAAPARSTPRPAAKPKAMGDDNYNPDVKQRLKDDQYNPDVKQRRSSKPTDLEEAKEAVRRGNAAREAMSSAANRMRVGDLPKQGAGLSALSKMKSGGSVKGWGIARGARKAKTY